MGGIAGWAFTAFFVQPLNAAFLARSDAAQILAKFETLDFHEQVGDAEMAKDALLEERRKAYVECGAKLVGFDLSYPWFSPWLRRIGFNIGSAGHLLILLGRLTPGRDGIDARNRAMAALRLGHKLARGQRSG